MKNNEIINKVYWAMWAILAGLHLFGILHFLNAESLLNYFGLNVNSLGYQIMIVLLMLGMIWFVGLVVVGIIGFIIVSLIGKNIFEPENMMSFLHPFNLRIHNFIYSTGLFINKAALTLLIDVILIPILLALNILQYGADYQLPFLIVLTYCLVEIFIPLKFIEKLNNLYKYKKPRI